MLELVLGFETGMWQRCMEKTSAIGRCSDCGTKVNRHVLESSSITLLIHDFLYFNTTPRTRVHTFWLFLCVQVCSSELGGGGGHQSGRGRRLFCGSEGPGGAAGPLLHRGGAGPDPFRGIWWPCASLGSLHQRLMLLIKLYSLPLKTVHIPHSKP